MQGATHSTAEAPTPYVRPTKMPARKVPNWARNGWSIPRCPRMSAIRSGVHVWPQMLAAGSGESQKKITNVKKTTAKSTPSAAPRRRTT
jgi:hypothetical protein